MWFGRFLFLLTMKMVCGVILLSTSNWRKYKKKTTVTCQFAAFKLALIVQFSLNNLEGRACKSKCYLINIYSYMHTYILSHKYKCKYKYVYLPATVIFAVPLIRLKCGPSLDTSHLYTPELCGRNCSNLTRHCVSSQLNVWSANLIPSTVKFIYLGTISGAYLAMDSK